MSRYVHPLQPTKWRETMIPVTSLISFGRSTIMTAEHTPVASPRQVTSDTPPTKRKRFEGIPSYWRPCCLKLKLLGTLRGVYTGQWKSLGHGLNRAVQRIKDNAQFISWKQLLTQGSLKDSRHNFWCRQGTPKVLVTLLKAFTSFYLACYAISELKIQ